MYDVATAFNDLVVVSQSDVPLSASKAFRDRHPEADAFLEASEEERDRMREAATRTAEARRRAALLAPRPLPREHKPFKIDDRTRAYIQQAVRVGVSLRELATRLNVSRRTIKTATEAKKKIGRPRISSAVRAQIHQLFATNLSQSDIARRLGVSRKFVWKVLQE